MTTSRSSTVSRTLCFLLGLSALATVCEGATSLSRHGITWTFDQDYTTGQYANGDYWVVGPVRIIAISPASTLVSGRTQHGSMINPLPNTRDRAYRSAYDSALRYGGFDATRNVARPNGANLSASNSLLVPAGSSLMSSRTAAAAESRPQLEDLAILTVVASAPPSGSFRPPYVGTDKTHRWNTSQINFGALRSLAPVQGTPSLSSVESNFERVWNEQDTEYTGEYLRASNNGPSYGRNLCYEISPALLSLQLNYTNEQKRTLLIRILQYGIDIYGVARNGGIWYNNGGHAQGRKMVMLLTAAVLGDSQMMAYGDARQHFIFQEDHQTFYVTQAEVNLTNSSQWSPDSRTPNPQPYRASDIGLAEWGITHFTDPANDVNTWESVYRDNNISSVIAGALVARLMGLNDEWNWPAFFDYQDRAFAIEESLGIGQTDEIQTFDYYMWKAYRNLGQTETPPVTPNALTLD